MRSCGSLALVALVLVSLFASACQSGPSGSISLMVSGDPADEAAYQKLIGAFEAKNSGMKVELINIPSGGDFNTRLAADLAAGAPADIVLINYRRVAAYAAKNAFEPLGPYLTKSTLISPSDFYPQAMQAFDFGGPLCIPQNISSPAFYYNKEMFDAAGVAYPADDWSWDDMLEAAQALTLDTNGDGAIDQYGFGVEPELIRLAPFVLQTGASLVDDYNAPTQFALDTPEGLKAFQWFVDLQVKWHVVPTAEEEASEASESRFLNGRTAMYMNSRRGVPTYRETAKFDWDVAPLPSDQYRASILHSDGYCVTSASKNKGVAWAFIEFANSVEGQTIMAGTGRTVPSNATVAESPAFLEPNLPPANSKVFIDAVAAISSLPRVSTWLEIEEIADNEIKQAFYGNISIEEAVRNMNSLAAEEFKRGVSGEID